MTLNSFDRRRMLGIFAGIGAAGLTGSLAACNVSRSTAPKETVRLGLIAPLAGGPNKPVGREIENGVKLYLEMRAGKMSGHDIDLIIEEEGDTVESGIKAVESLHSKGVAAVIGIANPDLLPLVRDIVEKNKIPMLAAHGSTPDMSSAIYIWRTAFVNNEPGRAVGLYLKSQTSIKKTSLVAMEDNLGKEVIAGFQKENSTGPSTEWIATSTKADPSAFGKAAENVMRTNADAVFCWLPPTHILGFVAALRGAGWRNDIYAPGLSSEGLNATQLEAARGLYTAMQYSSDLSNPSNRTFSAQFQETYRQSPTAYAVAAYDAAAVVDGAIALCLDERVTPHLLNQQISNVGQVVSPRGNWQFTQGRTPQQRWYLRQVRLDGAIWSNTLIGDLATLG
jgi:branched-chain amino acid transport system substrate-binding protein